MLLKMAHVSMNLDPSSSQDRSTIPPGWTLKSRFDDIYNPENKVCFLPNYEPTHTLSLFQRDRYIDIELVSQKSTSPTILFTAVSRADEGLFLYVPYRMSSESVLFFRTLGFYENGSEHTLTSRHALDEFDISITDAAPPKDAVKIDIYAAAFLSSGIAKDVAKLSRHPFVITPIETIDLGEAKIRCFFLIGPAGEIVEVYEYVKE